MEKDVLDKQTHNLNWYTGSKFDMHYAFPFGRQEIAVSIFCPENQDEDQCYKYAPFLCMRKPSNI